MENGGNKNLIAREKKEKLPIANQIVVATNFLYRDYTALAEEEQRQENDTDGVRGDLALEAIDKATDLGIHVVAADGGSSVDFLSALEIFRVKGLTVVKSEIAGRAPQRRLAFEAAMLFSNIKAVVYTQAEKVSLLDYLPEITQPILENTADIVIPGRNPELFHQFYPDYMKESELRANATYNWVVRRAGLMTKDQSFDWFFGPVVFKNDPEIIGFF